MEKTVCQCVGLIDTVHCLKSRCEKGTEIYGGVEMVAGIGWEYIDWMRKSSLEGGNRLVVVS